MSLTTLPILPPEIRKIIWEIKLISECTESEYGYVLFVFKAMPDDRTSLLASTEIYREINIHDIFPQILQSKNIIVDTTYYYFPSYILFRDMTGKEWEIKNKKIPLKKIRRYWKQEGINEFFRHLVKEQSFDSLNYTLFIRNNPAVEFLASLHVVTDFVKIFQSYRQLLQWKPNKNYDLIFVRIISFFYYDETPEESSKIQRISCEKIHQKEIGYEWNTQGFKSRLVRICCREGWGYSECWDNSKIIRLYLDGDGETFTLDPDEFWKRLTLTIREERLFGYCIVPATPDVKRILKCYNKF